MPPSRIMFHLRSPGLEAAPRSGGEALPPVTAFVARPPRAVSRRFALAATAAFLATGERAAAALPGRAPAPPGRVTGLALSGGITDGRAPLRWDPDGASAAYAIEERAVGTAGFTRVRSGVAATEALVPATPGQPDKDVRVVGVNAAGEGPPSAPLRVAGAAAPAPGALSVPFRIKAVAAMPAGSPVTWFQPFAPGDVPAGSRVTLAAVRPQGEGSSRPARDAGQTGAGVTVAVQQDQEVTWPASMPEVAHRRSLRGAALSFLTPADIPAGRVATFVIGVAPGAPNRTPHATLAQVRAASDLKLVLNGLDLGGDVMELAFNEVTAGFPEAGPTAPVGPKDGPTWGVNPVGGWEVIRSGPLCVEWLAWRYTRRRGDGAHHRWQKAQLYVRQWRDGQREITPVLSQPNAYAAHPTGAVGPAVQTRIACYAELFDGPRRLHAYAGPHASAAVTVPTSKIGEVGLNIFTMPSACQDYWGLGSAIGLSGRLPANMSASKVYYPYDHGDGRYVTFTERRLRANLNHRGDATVAVGAVPAGGAVTLMPAAATYPACGLVLMTPEAHPVWVGGAGRPLYLPALDERYLTRRSRLVPPYDLSVERPAAAAATAARWRIGSTNDEIVNLDKGSDDERTDRIGYLPVTSANLVVLPFDGHKDFVCRRLALEWANFTIWLEDHRSGRPAVSDNGPNDRGATYPGMGPPNPTLGMHLTNGAQGLPPWGGSTLWNPPGDDPGHPGYVRQYGIPCDSSHVGDFTTMPLLRTGHHVYSALAAATASFLHATWTDRRQTENGTTYYSALNKSFGRNQAWTTRTMTTAEAVVPDSNPYRAVLKHQLDSLSAFLAAHTPNSPTGHLGVVTGGQWSPPWQMAMHLFTLCMEVWRGTRPAWKVPAANQAKFIVRAFADDLDVPNGGYAVFLYGRVRNDDGGDFGGSGRIWPDIAAMMKQFSKHDPFKPTGFYRNGVVIDGVPASEGQYESLNYYPHMHAATLSLLKLLHDLGELVTPETAAAGRVRSQQVKRRRQGGKLPSPYIKPGDPGSAVMTWAVSPVEV